jgi:hypothetical protein
MKILRSLIVIMLLTTAVFAATKNYSGAIADAPVVLTTDGPSADTTNEGQPFTITMYTASLQNDDTYMVGVSKYGFNLTDADLDRATQGFTNSLNGKVLSQNRITISGQAAESSVVESVRNNRTLRMFLVVTFRGNTAYMFVFGTWMDTQGTDNAAVKTFFTSASLE